MQNYSLEYLAKLHLEKEHLFFTGNTFIHAERLLDQEISRVRAALFDIRFKKNDKELPDPDGEVVVLEEKVFVSQKENLKHNLIGRILGPRGLTAKQLEEDTGCQVLVHGQGSIRDSFKEATLRGKPNWEHLNEKLHLLVRCEDTLNRATVKLSNAIHLVNKLLDPKAEGMEELRRKQLAELAIMNGNFRSPNNNVGPYKTVIQMNLITPTSMVGPSFSLNRVASTFIPRNSSGVYSGGSPYTPSPTQHRGAFMPMQQMQNHLSATSSNYTDDRAALLSPSTPGGRQNGIAHDYSPPTTPTAMRNDVRARLLEFMRQQNRFPLGNEHPGYGM